MQIEHLGPAAVGLLTDTDDIKQHATLILGGLLLLALAFESLGYTIGPLGQQVVGAFPLLLAYFYGSKVAEVKANA